MKIFQIAFDITKLKVRTQSNTSCTQTCSGLAHGEMLEEITKLIYTK